MSLATVDDDSAVADHRRAEGFEGGLSTGASLLYHIAPIDSELLFGEGPFPLGSSALWCTNTILDYG
jgi:hypothetical protein